jgi:hypothetical protein
MPITGNVAWDERLTAFKGRDTTDFVTLAGATATICAACGLALQPEEQLSLLVDITEGTDAAGMEYLTFDCCICHRHCQEPLLKVRQCIGGPEELATLGARLTLDQRARTWSRTIPALAYTWTRTIPALAYTLTPVLTFREPGGEPTSALVSVLLDHGFQLSMTTDYIEIIQHTRDVGPGVSCTVTAHRSASLEVCLQIWGEQMYSHGLDAADTGDAHWLRTAAREGKILVMSGDYLDITDAGLNLAAAARLGTLVTGNVPFLP